MTRMLATSILSVIAVGLMSTQSQAQISISKEPPTRQDNEAKRDGGAISEHQLRRLIEQAGYAIETDHGKNVFEIQATQDDWTFPILVELSIDGSNMWCTVILNEFAGQPEQHAVRFSKLMSINGKYGNVFFKMDEDSKMMMLVGSESNRDMTAGKLDELVKLLMSVAVDTDALWKVNGEADGRGELTLIGNWRFDGSDRMMEFSFNDDGRFHAVFTENGKKDIFLGTFHVGDRQIALTSDEGDELVLPVEDMTQRELTINVDGMRYVLARR